MKSEEISVLKFENHPNTFLCKGENLKKEKSLKSNYSNSSSVETQFDSTENTQQKTITSTKDNESVNEVSTLINYNLSRKSSKMENPIMEKLLNDSNGENDTITSIINKEKSIHKVDSLSKSSEIEKDHSIDINKIMDNNSDLSKEQNTESSLVTNSLDSKPLTESPKTTNTVIEGKNIFNSSYFANSPESIKNTENGITRSESSPSVLKNDPKSKLISDSDNPPVKSNSQPPMPSTTFSNFKDKNSLNRIKKKEVIKELMESERLYVSDLQMLIENCFNPLEAVSWLPLNEKCLLIRNIQELFVFQQEFLEDMETSVKNLKEQLEAKKSTEEEMNQVMNECVRNISDCFIRRKKKFKVYSEFCSLHQEAINIFREYEYKPEMISFIRDFNGKTHSRLHLQDFLIKPVQRICKYPLLLKELIHYSDKDCEELNGLKEALTVMSEVAKEIDHVKWLIERVQRTDKFIDRLDIQDQFKYIIMERYGDMILSTGLEVVMEKERVNYRGVFLFRKHMFIVKPKRSKNYRVKMHLILDEFYFEAYPEYNAFRLIQKNTGIIIDFFAFSTVESKIWIELMETLVEPLEEIADKNKVFYIKSRNSYESHFSRFSLELKNLSNHHPVNQKSNSLRRAASSSLVNSSLEFLHPLDANSRTKRNSLKTMSTSIEKRESVGSSDSYQKVIDSVNDNNNNTNYNSNNDNNNNNNEEISLTTTPKVNPIQTSTFTALNSKRNTIQNVNLLTSKKSLQMISNIRKQNLHNISSVSSIKYNQSNMISTSGISTTADTEISSNGSDILYYDNGAIMDHDLIISEPSVATTETHLENESGKITGGGNENRLENESGIITGGDSEIHLESESGTVTGGDSENNYHLVSEPESFKSLPKKLDIMNDTMSTISKTDSVSTTTILPPKYKLIDSKFYDVYTYLFTNNDIQKIFSNLMYRSHEFDHLLYHKKTTRSRSNSCPRERYLFKSKERKEKEKHNANCCMTTVDDKNNFNKNDNRSSLYIPVCSDNRSIKSSRSSVNLYHNEEILNSPSSTKIFKHTRSKNSISSIRKMTTPIPSQNISSTPITDDSSVHSFNSLKYRKRHSISIFKSNSAVQSFEPSRFVTESQITVTDSPLSRCYSSLSDKMIDQDINFYFENMQNSENSNSTNQNLRKNSVNSIDTLSLNDLSMNHNNNTNNNTNINSNINTNNNTNINTNTNDNDYHSNYNYNINHTNIDINNIISSHGNSFNNSHRSPKAVHRQTVAIMDTNTLNSLYQLCNNDEDDNDSVSQNGSINSFSMKDENNDNHLNSYYQNRHSIAIDSNNMSSRSYDKVKNKKEKKIHFGNIKKIFAVGSRRSSSSSSSSSSLSKSSSFIFPKYSSENNLKKFTSKAFRSPSLSNLNRFSSSKNRTELSNLSTPIQYSKSPLVENVVINFKTLPTTPKRKNEKEQKISSSNEVNTLDRSTLYEEEDELEEFNSMEHLGGETDQEPELELESESKSKSKSELKLESSSQLQSKSTSEIDFHEEIKKLSSSSNSNHDLSTLMEEPKSYQSQQLNVDTTTSINVNNLSSNKNQDKHSINSLTSSHSNNNNNEHINSTILENTSNISNTDSKNGVHEISNQVQESKINLSIMKETEKDENKNNDDDIKVEGNTLKENRNNNNNISNNNLPTINTNHSNQSTSNLPISNNNNINVTPTSTRSHLKRNKTISLKLINLKKIF